MQHQREPQDTQVRPPARTRVAAAPSRASAAVDARSAARLGAGITPDTLATLQRTAGNTATVQFMADSVPVQRAVMSDNQWKTASGLRRMSVRTAELKAVDAALAEYNRAKALPATTDEIRLDLLSDLAEKIQTWQRTKAEYTGGPPDSAKAGSAAQLATEVEQERRGLTLTLRGGIEAGPEPRTDYQDVSVYQAGAMISETGAFTGPSAAERERVAAGLRQAVAKEADVRIAMLREKINAAYQQFKQQGADEDRVALFTAPEWFFKRPGTPFTRADRDKIVNAMLSLSSASPGMLIVPGSVVWGEGGDAGMVLRNGTVAVMNGRIIHETTKQTESADVRGYHPSPAELRPGNHAGAALGDQLRERFEGAERSATDTTAFALGNLSVSLEICVDHDKKRALEEMKERGGPRPHLQILISAGSRLGKSVVRDHGIGVSNDGLDLSGEVEGRGALRVAHVIGERQPDKRQMGETEIDRYTPFVPRPPRAADGAEPTAERLATMTEKSRLENHTDLATMFMGTYRLPG